MIVFYILSLSIWSKEVLLRQSLVSLQHFSSWGVFSSHCEAAPVEKPQEKNDPVSVSLWLLGSEFFVLKLSFFFPPFFEFLRENLLSSSLFRGSFFANSFQDKILRGSCTPVTPEAKIQVSVETSCLLSLWQIHILAIDSLSGKSRKGCSGISHLDTLGLTALAGRLD